MEMQQDRIADFKKMLLEISEERLGDGCRTMFAHHEAGHAVAAFLLGESITNINMSPEVLQNGDIVFGVVEAGEAPPGLREVRINEYDALTQEEKDILERNVMVSMAGEIYVRTVYEKDKEAGLKEDIGHVERVICWMFEDVEKREAYRISLSLRVKLLFEKRENLHAAAVLADTLLRKAEVSGDEATRIIAEAITAEGSDTCGSWKA